MCLEGVYGVFIPVASVDIRRPELVVTFPLLRDYIAVLLDGLVVEYLEVHLVAMLLEEDHYALVVIDEVEVLLGLEGLD